MYSRLRAKLLVGAAAGAPAAAGLRCDKNLNYDRIAIPLQTLHRRQQNTAMWDTLGSCMSDDTHMLWLTSSSYLVL